MKIENVQATIAPLQKQLLEHPLYDQINSLDDLKLFLEYHVFAVWDFMSLLKALQNNLTCTEVPWIPVGSPETRYLINEIVLAEETDINSEGQRQSHYEMYLDAMQDLDADTNQIKEFLEHFSSTKNIFTCIKTSGLPEALKDFLNFTFEVSSYGKPHEIAAAFTFGREDLIPGMFSEILRNFQQNLPEVNIEKLIYYFERHIELDEDEHGPMAIKMIEELCENDSNKWKEVENISQLALEKRIQLWDTIQLSLTQNTLILES
ncbi:DUF3050 domain-containing protein [Winogradskyella ursingii]|uniref:DUF3050 domain-containing protein n=1 Tax=Winogradskyella ursingii TaxID=2686079 RepID=UPI0015C969FA|nr:DUF3050 domain-containing protein [Winogradskyella ursingii]